MKILLLMRYSLSILVVALFAIKSSQAQVSPLVSWEFSRLPTLLVGDSIITSTSTDIGVEQSTLSRGKGLDFSSLARAYGNVSQTYLDLYGPLPTPNPSPLPATSKVHAQTYGDYLQFKFMPKPGNSVNLSAIDFKYRRSGAGARYYRWAYKLNNSNTFVEVGPNDGSYLTSETDGVVQPSIDLTLIEELQDLTSTDSVVFRLYLWGFTSQTGSAALGRYNTATDFTPSLALRGVVINTSTSTLLVWNFNKAKAGAATDGKEAEVEATTVNTNLNVPKIVRGAGITAPTTGFASSINGVFPNWSSPSIATFATAQANNEYYEFEVSSNETDKFISLFNINARVRRTGGGAPNYRWMYSLDDAVFVPIGNDLTLAASDHGYALPTVDLSAISELRNIPSSSKVKFRVYFWGATSVGGVTAIGGVSPYETANNEFYNGLELKGLITDAPLPVTLTSFTAKSQASTVNLNWSTASETDNSHFNITRSIDGKVFDIIGTAKGNGTTNNTSNYKFTDFSPSSGMNYYQLRQVDFNGKSLLSKIEAVNFSLNNRSFSAYTIQGQSGVKLSLYSEAVEDVKVLITNLKGEEISRGSFKTVKGSNSFNLPAQLSTGVYVASLLSKNGNLATKFIKE